MPRPYAPRVDRPTSLPAPAVLALVGALVAALVVGVGSPAEAKRATKLKAHWGDTRYVAGTDQLIVKGRVNGPRRTVLVEYKSDGWHRLAKVRSSRKSKFAVRREFNWFGSHQIRVRAPATRKFRDRSSRAVTYRITRGYAPTGDPTDYQPVTANGAKVRWDPCSAPIRYRVNYDDIGPGILPVIDAAMDHVTAATGIPTVYQGRTKKLALKTKRYPKNTDLLLGWASSAEYPRFGTAYAGFGGTVKGVWARDKAGRRVIKSLKGGVLFNSDMIGSFNPALDSADLTRPLQGRLILHEVGHVLGLNHSVTAQQVMYFRLTAEPDSDGLQHTRYAAGDLTGLKRLGASSGCLRKDRSRNRSLPVPALEPLP